MSTVNKQIKGSVVSTVVDFFSLLSSAVNDIRRKIYMVGTYSTVGKQAKRMPDPTVETTILDSKNKFLHYIF